MNPSKKTRLLLVFLAIFIAAVTQVVTPQATRTPPLHIDTWTFTEYENMDQMERWYFLVGLTLGTLTMYNATLEVIEADDLSSILKHFEVFRNLLRVDVLDVHTELNYLEKLPYGSHRELPLWALPYRIAPTLKGVTNAY